MLAPRRQSSAWHPCSELPWPHIIEAAGAQAIEVPRSSSTSHSASVRWLAWPKVTLRSRKPVSNKWTSGSLPKRWRSASRVSGAVGLMDVAGVTLAASGAGLASIISFSSLAVPRTRAPRHGR